MREAKQNGEAMMSIPEDTALYFFSDVRSPTRVFAFTPGVLSPGPMTAKTIAEMEEVPVRYVIWSNRQFPEYGVSEFGVDFDVPFAEYIRRNYRPIREFSSSNRPDGWRATLWERKERRKKAPATFSHRHSYQETLSSPFGDSPSFPQ